MNAFGISPAQKPAIRMTLDGASQLDPAALYDAILIMADTMPAGDLERLANDLGRAAWDKQRNAPA